MKNLARSRLVIDMICWYSFQDLPDSPLSKLIRESTPVASHGGSNLQVFEDFFQQFIVKTNDRPHFLVLQVIDSMPLPIPDATPIRKIPSRLTSRPSTKSNSARAAEGVLKAKL
jgi:hypothetical protein